MKTNDRIQRLAESVRRGRSTLSEARPMPTTPQQWQLYTDEKGAGAAARALTAALKQAEKKARAQLKPGMTSNEAASLLYKIFRATIDPVQDKYAAVGAADTEPRTAAKDYLQSIAHDLGIYGYIDF